MIWFAYNNKKKHLNTQNKGDWKKKEKEKQSLAVKSWCGGPRSTTLAPHVKREFHSKSGLILLPFVPKENLSKEKHASCCVDTYRVGQKPDWTAKTEGQSMVFWDEAPDCEETRATQQELNLFSPILGWFDCYRRIVLSSWCVATSIE